MIDEEDALALLLHHRDAVLGLEGEVEELVLEVGAVGVGAKEGPVPQAAEGELAE